MPDDYIPLEYPKWLHREGQPDTLVQDAAEELLVLAAVRNAALSDAAPAPAEPPVE